MFGLAGSERVLQAICNGRERLRVEAFSRVGQLACDDLLVLAERVELRLKVDEPGLELAGFEVAALECPVVAIERPFGPADLLGNRALPFLDRRPFRCLLVVGALERVGDHVAVAVETGQLSEYGGFELVAAEPLAVAGFAAELLAARAGVVVVDAAVALCAHADVRAPTTATPDHPGEQELGPVPAPQGQVLAALVQQRLRCLEGGLVDERLVKAGIALAAPMDAAEIGLVLKQPLHDGGLPTSGRRRRTLLGQQPGDRGGSEPIARVELEDAPHDWRLPLIRDHVLVVVAAVAERELPRRPASFLGASFDAGGDTVDDRRVLELREHCQHLQHHPPGGRPCIEWLRGGTECNAEAIELFRELRELLDLAAQAVDAVDEQQIDLPGAGEVERRAQTGPVELRPGRAVLLASDHPPAFL